MAQTPLNIAQNAIILHTLGVQVNPLHPPGPFFANRALTEEASLCPNVADLNNASHHAS